MKLGTPAFRGICCILFGLIHCSSADEPKSSVALYSSMDQWMRDYFRAADRQIHVFVETNRSCPLSNAIQIALELHDERFRKSVSAIEFVDLKSVPGPEYRVFAVTNSWRVRITFCVPTNGLSSDAFKEFRSSIERYVQLRKNGMSRDYADDSLKMSRELFVANASESPVDRIRKTEWVPDKWISKAYSTADKVIVMDGAFAWIYHPYSQSVKIDRKEFDPELGPVIAAVQIEALKEAFLMTNGPRVLSPTQIWSSAQKSLRINHKIDWASPQDLNDGDVLNGEIFRLLNSNNRWWITNR